MKNLNTLTTQEVQDIIWETLENKTGAEVLRAFTNWHGTQLLTPEFLEALSDDGLTDEEYSFEDDEDEEEEQDNRYELADEDTLEFLQTVDDEELDLMYSNAVRIYSTVEKIANDTKELPTRTAKVEHVINAMKAIASVCQGSYQSSYGDSGVPKVTFTSNKFEEVSIYLYDYKSSGRLALCVSNWFDYKKPNNEVQSVDFDTLRIICEDRLNKSFSTSWVYAD